MKEIKTLLMKDTSDKLHIKKSMICDLPCRAVILGASGSGKGNLLGQMILDPYKQFYGDDFRGEDIYIFSGSLSTDEKMASIIKYKKVNDNNVYDYYDDEILNLIYDTIIEKVKICKEDKKKVPNSLIILDDLSYSKTVSAHRKNALDRVYCNGRKNGVSIMYVSQSYSGIPSTSIRENSNLFVLYNMSNRQLDLASDDHNYLKNKKGFKNLFRENVIETYDKLIVNYTNPKKEMYLNSNWVPIDTSKYN